MFPYPVLLLFSVWEIKLGLELKGEGFLEVDGPHGLVPGHLGRPDFTLGQGQDDGLGQNSDKLLRNLVAWLRDSELAPVLWCWSFFLVWGTLEAFVNLGVLWVPDGQDQVVWVADLKVNSAVDDLSKTIRVKVGFNTAQLCKKSSQKRTQIRLTLLFFTVNCR